MRAFFWLWVAWCFWGASAYYLPGVAPVDFKEEDDVPLKVNKLTSVHTQLPYKFYSLPFCRPSRIVDKVENLGEILRGDRIENSLYEIRMQRDKSCEFLCERDYKPSEVKHFAEMIAQEYKVHWIVDNLPAATRKVLLGPNQENTVVYDDGFALGSNKPSDLADKKHHQHLNNHVNIILYHHPNPTSGSSQIVGFEVVPASIKHTDKEHLDCAPSSPTPLVLDSHKENLHVIWTYSVKWIASEIPWANRWDLYLTNTDPQIHWFSIINSMMIVLFLTGMVAMIMMRTLHADFRRYNSLEANEEAEETGWKLVHGDVFRPPTHPLLLSVLVGSGAQVFCMTLITMVFAVLGFLSPANRGGLLTAMVVLFVVMGVFAGYTATRMYKMFKGSDWKRVAFTTSFFFSGIIFGIFFFLDLLIWGKKSSASVGFSTFMALISLWFGISVPLTFFGSYFAWKKPPVENPVRTNQIPRQIPDQVWYMSPVFSILMGGILPFGAVFIELFFILSAIWGHHLYYIFGFLFIVFCILIITSAEITIVMCYFQLCSEDYHWWWRSFLTSGSSAFYMFLYSVFYFFTKLEITQFVSALLYFGYTFILSFAFFVLTGAVGYWACYMFVRKIYGQVKVD